MTALVFVDKTTHEPCPTEGNVLCTVGRTDPHHLHVAAHAVKSNDPPAVIPTTADMVESASVAARFLDSLGIRPINLRVTELGRVECYVDPHLFDRARRALINDGATFHDEDGFVYVEARLDGVPVQVWTAVER